MAVGEESAEGQFLGRGVVCGGVFGDVGEEDDEEGECEDRHSSIHEGEGVGDAGVDDGGDEEARDDDDGSAAEGVEGAAELDELVATVAATAEAVEHGVDDGVE